MREMCRFAGLVDIHIEWRRMRIEMIVGSNNLVWNLSFLLPNHSHLQGYYSMCVI